MKISIFFSSLFLLLFLESCKQSETTNNKEVISRTTLFDVSMQEGISCYRIPSIVTASNGDLVAAIDERVPSCGDLKYSKDINIVIRRSSDNGVTWQPIERVVDFPYGKSASDPSMIVDKVTNEIFLFYNYMDLENEKDVYYLHYVKSKDNGFTWSKSVDITSQIAKPEWKNDFKFITSGRGTQTREGVLLHTMVNLNNGLHVFGSKDHGQSWFLIDKAIKPGNESKIIELSDGKWMINCRANQKGMRYSHVSNDQGLSWTTKAETSLLDPGCNGCIINYTSKKDQFKKNRLLFCNANNSKKRENLTIRISYDDGQTWSKGKVIYSGPSAYSSMTILENGDIAVFYEKDNCSKNEVVIFPLGWLTNGKDFLDK